MKPPPPICNLFYNIFICYILLVKFVATEQQQKNFDDKLPDDATLPSPSPPKTTDPIRINGTGIVTPTKIIVNARDTIDDYEASFEMPESQPAGGQFKIFGSITNVKVVIPPPDLAIYACGDKNDDDETISKLCKCSNNIFDCYNNGRNEQQKISRTNFTILQENFIVKKAIFSENRIENLTKGSILPGHESTIEELMLDRGQINFIENGTFDKFVNLRKLSLSLNRFKEIHEGILTPQLGKTIKELYLSFLGMETMELKIFQNYIKLTHLDLEGTMGPFLDSSNIFPEGLSNLKVLNMKHCPFSKINNDIFINLKNLKELQLRLIDVTSIPTSIKVLSNLKELYLGAYMIENIGDCAFCGLNKLTKVNLGFNSALRYIHENAFGAISNHTTAPIKYFTIWFCQIEVLPEKLLDWKNVDTMEIDSNPFTCNCSMAWLINDLQSKNSIYKKTIKHYMDVIGALGGMGPMGPMGSIGNAAAAQNQFLTCANPPNLRGTPLINVPNEFCNSTNSIEDESEIIYVCGDGEEAETNCICENNILRCSDGVGFENFNHPGNIQIMDPDFILKIAKFDHFGIKSLKKDKLLPGREHKITELIFNFNEANHEFLHIENGTFDNFISLRTLQLTYQKLTNISDGVLTKSVGAKLLHLNLGFNIFPNLNSIGFMHLTKLTHLNLEFNQKIDFALPENVFPESLANLNSLNLVGCKIKNFNDAVFIHLKNLKTLLLTQNYITTIPKAFYHLQNLKHLRMDQNKLTTLVKNQFENNTKLEYLNLDYNNFSTIEDCTFCNLSNLKNIYLSNNPKLNYIHENAFGFISTEKTPKLDYFYMKNCNFPNIPENLLNWKNVKHILIGFNPFICECQTTSWLIEAIKNSSSPLHEKIAKHYGNSIQDEFECFNPIKSLKGRLFSNISIEEDLCNPETSKSAAALNENAFSQNHWLLAIIIFAILASAFLVSIGIYFYRQKRSVEFVPYKRRSEEEDKIEEDFDTNNV